MQTKNKKILTTLLSVLIPVFVVSGIALAVTTIGTDITTQGDLTVDTDTLYVDSANHRMGVGTISPAHKLDVNAGTSLRGINVVNNQVVNNDLYGVYSSVQLDDEGNYSSRQYGGYFEATGSGSVNQSYGIYAVSNATYADEGSVGVYGEGDIHGVYGYGYFGVKGYGETYGIAGTGGTYGIYGSVISGHKSSAVYSGYFSNNATSFTNSINKYGLYITSNGSWTGAGAKNYGLYVDEPTGGTSNYAAVFAGGNVGIGTTNPQSNLHVPDGKYAQFADSNTGAPPAGDCDSDDERGRLSIDTTNNRVYICNGATRGWDYWDLTD